jgi:hypothetical protein
VLIRTAIAKPAIPMLAASAADLNKSTYSGEFGFLIVEPAAGDPGAYDREVLLAAHHWQGHWVSGPAHGAFRFCLLEPPLLP